MKNTYPLLQLPTNVELILYLIREDLKCQKFFDGLRNVGLDDCYYQPELGLLIITYAGLDPEKDEDSDLYYNLVAEHIKDMEASRESVTRKALSIYMKLVEKRK